MKKLIIFIVVLILIGGTSFSQTWEPINNSGTIHKLTGMSFPPNQNNIGFACTYKLDHHTYGVVVKTTDGGNNWVPIWGTGDTTIGLEAIWFVNEQVGFANGWNSYFMKTSDGGTTWNKISCGSNVWYYSDVVFRDENNGVAAAAMEGDYESIFITGDGGDTWVPATSGSNVNITSVCYADDNNLFAVGSAGNIHKSMDGGHNWTIIASPGVKLAGVDFANSLFGVVGGEENIYITRDGGETWTNKKTDISYELFRGVKAFENGTAYVAGNDIWMTTDYGETFVIDYEGGFDVTYNRVRSTPNGNLFACGTEGNILRKSMPLTANFTADHTVVCIGDTVNFSDLSMGIVTAWNWTFEGGSPTTSAEQKPGIVYNIPGVYDVTLQVSDGTNTNTKIITAMITVVESNGIIENGLEVFSIYPNPGVDAIHIKIRLEKDEGYTLTLMNLTGQTIRTIEGKGTGLQEILEMDITDLSQGQYIIGIASATEKVSYQKFIVSK